MRRWSLLLTLLFPLALAASDRDFGPLERETEGLRGLRFKKPVITLLVDDKALKAALQAQMRKEYPEAEWPIMEKSLKAFSLIPPKMNMRAVMNGLLEEQVVGLYDPDSKKLYVNDRPLGGDDLLEGLVGEGFQLGDAYILHEMVHALTDQSFDLNALPLKDKDNEDRASAARCVVEGDATWVMFRYLFGMLKIPSEQQGQVGDLMLGMNMGRELLGSGIPAYLQENLLVGYLGGLALVKTAFDRGGFPAVNALYSNPPKSMEQVLHPEKYYGGSDPPIAILLVSPKAFRGAGWKDLPSGTWGEFNARVILQEWGVDAGPAHRASEGWGGDRYQVFEGPGGELGFAWATVWDTEKDATEFAAAAAKGRGVDVLRDGKKVMLTRGAPASPKAAKVP